MFRYPINDARTPSRATYLAVAEATDRDPMELPPLMRAIDTDALDALLGTSPDDEMITITFEYGGCDVIVTSEEVTVRLEEPPQSGSPQ